MRLSAEIDSEASGLRTRTSAVHDAGARAEAPARLPSFEQVYEAEFAFVWRSARSLGADPAQLEDIAQEVFVVVHRQLPDLRLTGSMRSWLFGVVRLVVARHRRTARRKPSHAGQAEATDLDAFQDGALDPEAQAERAEAVATLDRALAQLDDDKRAVLVLTEIEGMTMAEIGDALGVNVNTIASRLRAARRLFETAVDRLEKYGRKL